MEGIPECVGICHALQSFDTYSYISIPVLYDYNYYCLDYDYRSFSLVFFARHPDTPGFDLQGSEGPTVAITSGASSGANAAAPKGRVAGASVFV